jgi:hypothetical protein
LALNGLTEMRVDSHQVVDPPLDHRDKGLARSTSPEKLVR